MPLALGSEQHIHLFYFGAVEQQVRWQDALADAAPVVTASVNNRVARRTVLLAKADTEGLEAVAGQSEWQSLRAAADAAVAAGRTTVDELARVLGPSRPAV